jgi:hypothetical protein
VPATQELRICDTVRKITFIYSKQVDMHVIFMNLIHKLILEVRVFSSGEPPTSEILGSHGSKSFGILCCVVS